MKENEKEPLSPLQKADLPTGLLPGGFRRFRADFEARGGVSRKRILGDAESVNCYHVMSRTAGGEMLFGEVEKEAFVKILRRLERFAGVEVLTFCVMDNHFHLLTRVPTREKFLRRFEGESGEKRLLEHLQLLYSKGYVAALKHELTDLRAKRMHDSAEDLLNRYRKRFCNLPLFVKELKERFSRWFNKYHDRRGTLWMDRYKSVLVEDGNALRTMAAYIDLNPVRAGIVEDPKDYRWCGYAEAVSGSKRARRGLCRVMQRPLDSWGLKPQGENLTPAGSYRCWLFGEGREVAKGPTARARKGISRKKVRQVLDRGGQLSRTELLHCRVRYFSDGVAIGSKSFVEGIFQQSRDHFGTKRKDGARKLRESAGTGLFSLRALRVQAVE